MSDDRSDADAAPRSQAGEETRRTAPPRTIPPPTLPFGSCSAPRRDTPPIHSSPEADAAGALRGGTVNLANPPALPVLPFLPPGPEDGAELDRRTVPIPAPTSAGLSLEQYASLAAELAVWPAAGAAVRARYGLDEAAHRREQEIWQTRLSDDPALFARYAVLFQQYREWLGMHGG